MGLIEDAQALVCPRDIAENCFYCGSDVPDDPHLPGCPWLAMPRIVTALEAAAALVKVIDRSSVHYPSTITNIKTGEQIPTCESYCSTWPCDAAKVDDAADALRDALAGGQ